jgi:hypothetical protein
MLRILAFRLESLLQEVYHIETRAIHKDMWLVLAYLKNLWLLIFVIFPVSSDVLSSENWTSDSSSSMSCGGTGSRDGPLNPVDPGWAPGTPRDPS